MRDYQDISGAKFGMDKAVGLRAGPAKLTAPPTRYSEGETKIRWYKYGVDDIPPKDKYLGIRFATTGVEHTLPSGSVAPSLLRW